MKGPGEELSLKDAELQRMLKDYQRMEESAVACRFIANRDGYQPGDCGAGCMR